jgi:ABC-type antimicrobial peptide transport system ATPase subunit
VRQLMENPSHDHLRTLIAALPDFGPDVGRGRSLEMS